MGDILAGVYRHYKGPLYLVLGLAHDANAEEFFTADEEKYFPTGDRAVVVYVPLQLDGAHTGPRMAIRTDREIGDAFYDIVCTRSEHTHYGEAVPLEEQVVCNAVERFTYIGPTWEGESRTVPPWPGQKRGVHDHKPYEECPDNCPVQHPEWFD